MGAARPSRQGKKPCLTSPAIKTKSGPKDVNWADVTDPEERRRIQNRIAQRKFREKARENREKAERESRNQEHAGNSYRIPVGTDITTDNELSGLPWGSMSLGLVVSRGHEAESLRSSGRGTYVGDESYASPHSHFAMPLASELPELSELPQTASYGSSIGEDVFFDDASYVYDYDAATAHDTLFMPMCWDRRPLSQAHSSVQVRPASSCTVCSQVVGIRDIPASPTGSDGEKKGKGKRPMCS
ncbi:hypothetical protein XA68_10833 [Ophiocordyceps unilateralis]|uniref:BZIP domain-containing protein n=1 Tax=Ophiocordyceps unilateralis TaxID=268505 RepID=A0A2A9PGK3_OPHUN|nr:hypothetical protein XA68_10833 [Ophiocordyceps unilateralis]